MSRGFIQLFTNERPLVEFLDILRTGKIVIRVELRVRRVYGLVGSSRGIVSSSSFPSVCHQTIIQEIPAVAFRRDETNGDAPANGGFQEGILHFLPPRVLGRNNEFQTWSTWWIVGCSYLVTDNCGLGCCTENVSLSRIVVLETRRLIDHGENP